MKILLTVIRHLLSCSKYSEMSSYQYFLKVFSTMQLNIDESYNFIQMCFLLILIRNTPLHFAQIVKQLISLGNVILFASILMQIQIFMETTVPVRHFSRVLICYNQTCLKCFEISVNIYRKILWVFLSFFLSFFLFFFFFSCIMRYSCKLQFKHFQVGSGIPGFAQSTLKQYILNFYGKAWAIVRIFVQMQLDIYWSCSFNLTIQFFSECVPS